MLLATPAGSSVLLVRGQPAWLYVSLAHQHACYYGVCLRRVAACAALQLLQYAPSW